MSTTTEVTISSETDRCVIQSLIWDQTRDVLIEALDSDIGDALGEAANAALGIGRPTNGEVLIDLDEILERLAGLRADLDSVATATVGSTIDLHISTDSLLNALEYARRGVEEYANHDFVDGGFWNQAPEVRNHLISVRDSAARLEATFATEAVA